MSTKEAEIRYKISELLAVSAKKIDGDWEETIEKMNQQDLLINEIKVLAKKYGTILGRIIKFQYADSYAYYIITNIFPKTVYINWIDYCDGWIDDRCGKHSELPIEYAVEKIKTEDSLDKIFKPVANKY